jgi:hypothetical protein
MKNFCYMLLKLTVIHIVTVIFWCHLWFCFQLFLFTTVSYMPLPYSLLAHTNLHFVSLFHHKQMLHVSSRRSSTAVSLRLAHPCLVTQFVQVVFKKSVVHMWRDQTFHITGSNEKILGGGLKTLMRGMCMLACNLPSPFILCAWHYSPLKAVDPEIWIQTVQVYHHHHHHGMTLDLVDMTLIEVVIWNPAALARHS